MWHVDVGIEKTQESIEERPEESKEELIGKPTAEKDDGKPLIEKAQELIHAEESEVKMDDVVAEGNQPASVEAATSQEVSVEESKEVNISASQKEVEDNSNETNDANAQSEVENEDKEVNDGGSQKEDDNENKGAIAGASQKENGEDSKEVNGSGSHEETGGESKEVNGGSSNKDVTRRIEVPSSKVI